MTTVRPVHVDDADVWRELRADLWPEGSDEEHAAEVAQFFSGGRRNPLEVLLAEDAEGRPLGFAELSIRPYAEGCTEFASDALLDNHASAAARRALGFDEVAQIRCFRKVL
jgi:aminoglycoside 6'-N-acetyltransferase I